MTADAPTPVTTRVWVSGMTCGHCVASVTEELSEIDGVESVAVDLAPGADSRVTVTSTSPLDDAVLAAAIDEAGYATTRVQR